MRQTISVRELAAELGLPSSSLLGKLDALSIYAISDTSNLLISTAQRVKDQVALAQPPSLTLAGLAIHLRCPTTELRAQVIRLKGTLVGEQQEITPSKVAAQLITDAANRCFASGNKAYSAHDWSIAIENFEEGRRICGYNPNFVALANARGAMAPQSSNPPPYRRRPEPPRHSGGGKIRVSQLAAELGITSKDALVKLGEMGVYVKSASSTVEAPVSRRFREAFPDRQERRPEQAERRAAEQAERRAAEQAERRAAEQAERRAAEQAERRAAERQGAERQAAEQADGEWPYSAEQLLERWWSTIGSDEEERVSFAWKRIRLLVPNSDVRTQNASLAKMGTGKRRLSPGDIGFIRSVRNALEHDESERPTSAEVKSAVSNIERFVEKLSVSDLRRLSRIMPK